MRYAVILNVCLIGSVIENYGLIMNGIVDPFAKLLLGQHGARWVVGIAKIDHVYPVVGYLRNEMILCRARHVVDIAPLAVFHHASTSYHNIAVYVNGVDRVCHADAVVPPEDFLNVSGVALRAVVNEHLVGIDMYAARQKIVFNNSLTQEIISALRTVASECCFHSHLVNGLVHGLYNGRTKRLGNIAYAEADNPFLRMADLVGIDLLGYVGKQIVV